MRVMTALFLILMLVSGAVFSESLVRHEMRPDRIEVYTHPGDLLFESTGGGTLVSIPGMAQTIVPGRPALPFYHASILIPQDKTAGRVEVVFRGAPHKYTVTDIAPAAGVEVSGPIMSEATFPVKLYHAGFVQKLGGYRILPVTVYPVMYDLGRRELVFRGDFTITVHLESALQADSEPCFPDFAEKVRSIVVNPEALATYRQQALKKGPRADNPYLIITSPGFASNQDLLDFAAFIQNRGVATKILDTAYIYANYPGSANADKLRNAIIDEYANHAARYILLVGDADKAGEIVPVKRLWGGFNYTYLDGSHLGVREDIASDYYYAALDGNFNADGDSHIGEASDNVDMYPEVAVGRLPVSNATDLQRMLAKIQDAYNYVDNLSESPRMLLLGELLFYSGQYGLPSTSWGGDAMIMLYEGATYNGFTTNGVREVGWEKETLFEKDGSWGESDHISMINNYQPLATNHLGHASPTYCAMLDNSSYSSMTNSLPFIFYSIGCNAGRFTNETTTPILNGVDPLPEDSPSTSTTSYDCVTETLMTAQHGAFGIFANQSYGLGPEDPLEDDVDVTPCVPGAGLYHARFLWHALTQDIFRLGDMQAYAQESLVPWWNDPDMLVATIYWVVYEMNYFGDPYFPMPRVTIPDAPVLSPISNSDGDGNYTVSWSESSDPDGIASYELLELVNPGPVTDQADDFVNWDNNQFQRVTNQGHSGTTSFFSGNANSINHWMAAQNLYHVEPGDAVTLWCTYNIETNWDYAYVEVSTDGTNFTSIAGNITTTYDPYGNNDGNGITGNSGGWVAATFSLVSYVGDNIYIRLRYETDGYVLGDGIWFDDIYPVMSVESTSTIYNGADLSFGVAGNEVGIYQYMVRAWDTMGFESEWSNLEETEVTHTGGNQDPVLSNPSVTPATGYYGTRFEYRVDYGDADGDTPALLQVYIDGTGYDMTLNSGTPDNGTYRYLTRNITQGETHAYYFYTEDGNGGSGRIPASGTLSGPDTFDPELFISGTPGPGAWMTLEVWGAVDALWGAAWSKYNGPYYLPVSGLTYDIGPGNLHLVKKIADEPLNLDEFGYGTKDFQLPGNVASGTKYIQGTTKMNAFWAKTNADMFLVP